ncbi:hypothetical protein NE237_017184 [Protea cynaroides]|uniref:Deacetylase sirtuin-type domain-containing protein n=1 Tax=Protea cynaroides TaxID=273540 RepID=A0A9Q0QMJ7_9MAGN|nr:hypothetical protein NE237_017184 [Protea cynaroides]
MSTIPNRSLSAQAEPGSITGQGAMLDGSGSLQYSQWASAIESLEFGNPRSDKTFGMMQRHDDDIEIDGKLWKEDFHIPTCMKCNGVLKPDVIFFGDNVPKDRADKAMDAAKQCDALLVLGSSLMTKSAFRLVRAAHEAGATIAIVNIGVTQADDFVPLKINARFGEWALAIESLEFGNPRSDKTFGMMQRHDDDIEIDGKLWEEDFHIPTCMKCNGVLKPDVIFFGDNVPKDRANKAMDNAKQHDTLLVLGSSLMTKSAFRLVRYSMDISLTSQI